MTLVNHNILVNNLWLIILVSHIWFANIVGYGDNQMVEEPRNFEGLWVEALRIGEVQVSWIGSVARVMFSSHVPSPRGWLSWSYHGRLLPMLGGEGRPFTVGCAVHRTVPDQKPTVTVSSPLAPHEPYIGILCMQEIAKKKVNVVGR